MKKYLFLFILALTTSAMVHAQRQLEIKELPDKIAYNGEGKDAIVVVAADNIFKLEFSTNLDGERGSLIENQEVEAKGRENEYTLTVNAAKSKGATLIIRCPDYSDLSLRINLSANQAIKYQIDDPLYPDNKPCPVKHKLSGDNFFNTSSYSRARTEYVESLKCWDAQYKAKVDTAEIGRKINDIDTIFRLLKEIEDVEMRLVLNEDYKSLYEKYNRICELNATEDNLKKKREALLTYIGKCVTYTRAADSVFQKNPSSIEVLENYKKIIALGCENSELAKSRIETWNNQSINDTRHVFTYEYEKDNKIGISSGNYNNNWNVSGYFTLHINPNIFDLSRLEDSDTLQTEANISFGWTLKLFRLKDIVPKNSGFFNSGVWLFFGPGATAICKVNPKNSFNLEGNELERFYYHYAFSPEAGLLLKLTIPKRSASQRAGVGLVLRYTYQYRHAFKKEDDLLFGASKNFLGFGLCF
ncbi:hypothetical protein AGMMS50239_15740 [Bacteroidia bacterium]|nr:hypothetical protein AGMMS50239_15740 [Bacteroidia bacterium]